MIVKTYGSAIHGVSAVPITVEVNIGKGIGYHLVGLPDNAIKESNHRINSAIVNSGYKWPGRKIVINMAPADLRKEGSAYDLTIAIGILASSNQIPSVQIKEYLIMGELSLDGTLLPIKGVLPIAIKAQQEGFRGFILPKQNASEASIVKNLDIYGVDNIVEVIDFFKGEKKLEKENFDARKNFYDNLENIEFDFEDVRGQENVKRCMEIAASGGHNIILIGPPGSGKTMLAKRLPSILPPMTLKEALETTKIYSVAGKLKDNIGLLYERPFRAPHHTISDVALVGGGVYPQPGEISLSHNGVLFLDELPEFKRSVLEVMRQPLEDREVTISRARFTVNYPASFMLVASMNPSPSGYFKDDEKMNSSIVEMKKYMSKISGPLLDRIDIHLEINPVPFEKISSDRKGERSSVIRKRVIKAREIQTERFMGIEDIHYNAQMRKKQIEKYCSLCDRSKNLIKIAMDKLGFSARAYDRILKVSRTIADLENSYDIAPNHIAEAIQYRSLDRKMWSD